MQTELISKITNEQKDLKPQKRCFLPVSDLMSDSLMAIQVEPHQCPLLQSILLIKYLSYVKSVATFALTFYGFWS